jgi:hypothetical protein
MMIMIGFCTVWNNSVSQLTNGGFLGRAGHLTINEEELIPR